MIYVLIVFVSSFSLFLSPALSASNQSSNCAIDTECLEEMSEVSKIETVIKNTESSSEQIWKNWHSLFKVVSPPPLTIENLTVFSTETKAVSNETVQAVKQEIQSKIRTAKADEGQTEILAQLSRERCRNAPWIKKAVVFQSVEAPQIEPLQHQYEDQQGLPYGEYDLVRRKPAVVFVDIEGSRKRFGVLRVFVNNDLYFEEEIRASQRDFPIGLPMKADGLLDGVGSATVWIRFIPYNDPNCYDQISFKVTVWETKKLYLRFAKINNRNCKPLREYPLYKIGRHRTYQDSYKTNNLPYWPYGSVSFKDVENFKFSDEVQDYLPEMLPVAEEGFRIYRDIIDLEGHCDNRPVGEYDSSFKYYIESIGILEDINELERQRIKQKEAENKIVAIIPKNYIPFHRTNSFDVEVAEEATELYGFVLHKYIYTKWRVLGMFNWNVVAGSSHVLFVREDRYKHSTLSHELGHTLGQRGKEFYDPKHTCKDFKYQPDEDCDLYRIDRSLKFGQIKQKLLSIMHSGSIPINQKWIDRETFQKIFAYLLTDDNRQIASSILNSPLNRDRALSKDTAVTNEPIVIISGIYLKNGNLRKEKFFYDPKIEIHKEGGLLTPSTEGGDIQIELKLEGKVIYTNRLSSFAEIEFLREGGENNQTYKLSSVPITVSLPLLYGIDADYEIVIKQMINGSSERVLFSSKVPKSE